MELPLKTAADGSSCLHFASLEGHLAIVRFLIEASGEALLKCTANGHSCLHSASERGHLAAVVHLTKVGGEELLLKASACMQQQRMATLLWSSTWSRRAVRHFKAAEDGATCLHTAIQQGHLAVEKHQSEVGCDALLFKTDNAAGPSCLHVASQKGHLRWSHICSGWAERLSSTRPRRAVFSCLHSASSTGRLAGWWSGGR